MQDLNKQESIKEILDHQSNSQNNHQKKTKATFSELKQILATEDGLHHRKLLGFKKGQRFT
jgi:hypothetical protein